ncbi:30S ribosomal protein S8e [Candidatus Woesearchaeota archaeon]|nr:30S ribosomal protein S8e [Candidatus Woesearchaeota archaeon]
MIAQHRSRRKPSSGRYKKARDKRLYELGSEPTHTRLGARMLKRSRARGGNVKLRVIRSDVANVLDTKTGKHKLAKIKTVADNPASKHLVRRNIITRGAIIETELGKARVTNRPGQEGSVNAVLLK